MIALTIVLGNETNYKNGEIQVSGFRKRLSEGKSDMEDGSLEDKGFIFTSSYDIT